MPIRLSRLWIGALILSLLGQLAWAASMPVLTDRAAAATPTHAAHTPAAAASSSDVAHCDPAPGSGDHGPAAGHACCPLLGLAPVTTLRVAIAPHPSYGPAVARALNGDTVDAIFKPPKTRA